ncbi:MAG: iron-containing alcohol dehydrogenase family protein [Sedimentisphaeraceae bacterium JB056]
MSSTDFEFYLPTRIIFGGGCSEQTFDLDCVKGKCCMLLSYAGFNNTAFIAKLQESCGELINVDEFEENPSFSFVKKLGTMVSDKNVDTIIAIGGGSSIDSAKAAAWLSANPDWQIGSGDQPDIPETSIVAIPTTSGTGSEVTPYAILTDEQTKQKQILNHQALFPKAAVCDPDFTITMPKGVTVNTGIDALSHSIEAYMSTSCQGFMCQIALESCRRIKENLPLVIAEPSNSAAREAMMLAALEGGIVLARCGTVMVHALGYCLTAKYGYPHGYSNALLLGGFVERLAANGNQRAKGIMDIFDGDLSSFITSCGIPASLPSGSVESSQVDAWVESGYNSYGRVKSITPIEKSDIKYMIEKIID